MPDFTQGKWKYLDAIYSVVAYPEGTEEPYFNEEGYRIYPDGSMWQDIVYEVGGSNEEERDANGRLIAAAPDMYAFIRVIAEGFEDDEEGLSRDFSQEAARQLIARIDAKEEHMTETLKPCPFCGGEPVLEYRTNRIAFSSQPEQSSSSVRVICSRCATSSIWFSSAHSAALWWNRRKES